MAAARLPAGGPGLNSPSPGGPGINKRSFQQRYKELTLYYLEHGHCMVPVKCPSGLGGWVAYQRRLWKAGRMPLDHYHQLAALGFHFDAFASRWASRFRQLAEFHSRYGHCTVPASAAAEARWPGLRMWTLIQRQAWKRGILEDDRVRRLSGLGFVWQPAEARWEERFAELQAFKEEHGHCNVPKGWAGNQGLASWVERVRREWRARQGTRPLSHSREARLRALAFDFEPQQRSWGGRYAQLKELRSRVGHLAGPFPSSGAWAGLAEWVVQQRHRGRAGRLHPDRLQALDELGFVWDPEEGAWVKQLAALDGLVARVGLQMTRVLLEGETPQALRAATSDPSTTGLLLPPTPSGNGEPDTVSGPVASLHQASSSKLGFNSQGHQPKPTPEAAELLATDGGQPKKGSNRRRRKGTEGAAAAAEEPWAETCQLSGQLDTAREVMGLVRWYQAARRAATAGELGADRAAQLAQRGLALGVLLEE
ncbi:hypothetical protein N2152v2_009183 [Parachlorella kessleri]